MKRRNIIVRISILCTVALVSLIFFVSMIRQPVHRIFSGVSYPAIGVSLFWEPNMVVVRIDDREERVPTSQ